VTRAGTTTAFWWGPSISTSQANYNGSYSFDTFERRAGGERPDKTVPVDSFQPNPWGLYQVHGNVLEWCEDCWHDSYQGAPTDGSAWIKDAVANWRVLRGGSWQQEPRSLRSAHRSHNPAPNRTGDFGFRVARTLTP
jgi:formylglycine-generating enzyme required for sulfatase activity